RRRAEERAAAAGAAPADQKEVDVRHPLPAVLPADDALLGAERAGRARRLSWTLLGVVALVLMVACADAAGLLLARAERRRRELAIRVAVGASRARIVRQMLLEGALLAVGGAAAGVVLAMWLTDFVVASVPRDFAIPLGSATAVLAGRSLAFTMLAAAATALLFSTVPALRASRTDPAGVLKGAAPARAAAGARRGWRALGAPPLRGSLVVLQVALSAVLLVGAGLLLRTLANARGVPLGFDPAHAATGTVDLSRQGYDRERQRAFQSALLARLAAAPGVRAVALAASVPVSGPAFRNSAELEGYTPPPGEEPMVAVNVVSPGYFRAVGTPLLRGRDFTAADDARDAPPVVIVNQALADRYWPGQDAVGKRVLNIGKDGAMIVGVVADARHISLRDAPEPMVILPLGPFGASRLTVVARAAGGGAEAAAEGAMLRAIREAVAALDRDLPLLDMRSMRERVGVAVAQERLLAMLLSAFATLALVLSAAGLYGVVSYTAASRTREWGVRIALGARPRDVLLLVQRQGAALAAIGLAIGLAGALALSRVLGALLYEVAPDDALTYAAVGALLAAVSLLAAYVPARRATRVNPVDAMRSE
ncbi:MAG TPA: FtsX-like permease family protein, partial [Gemmatimonadaceae bacterium]|nr:FtsX-like permease family protein [Gemmatimonadaceae bacterium]